MTMHNRQVVGKSFSDLTDEEMGFVCGRGQAQTNGVEITPALTVTSWICVSVGGTAFVVSIASWAITH